MTQSHADGLTPSSRSNPCPVCGRDKDGDCRMGEALVLCHRGKTFHPPEVRRRGDVVTGKGDGQQWAYTGDSSDSRQAVFKLHQERPGSPAARKPAAAAPPAPDPAAIVLARLPQPGPVPPAHWSDGQRINYSANPEQWVAVKVEPHGEKRHYPWHIGDNGKPKCGKGHDPWPLWREADALAHGPGRWITEAEGEKCAAWLMAGCAVAISQPGHDHKLAAIRDRYRRLQAAGVVGVVYLADNDTTGEQKAQRCAAAAAAAGLQFLVIRAADVWPGLPEGGSIDDAPGTPAERLRALEAAIPAAVERREADRKRREEEMREEEEEGEPASYLELLQGCLLSIGTQDLNSEMAIKAELKARFRVTDEQISTALFKQHRDDKVQRKKATHDSVRLSAVEELRYRMDGHILIGDVGLLYGPYGTGKTTLALAKMHAHATGKNLLDRDTPCEPGKCLFIATDSGAAALKKALLDLGIDPDEDPLFMPGHPDQRIWIWAHEPDQGHAAWICDIHGVLQLEEFIKAKGITYVAIDSAKAVSTPAGWSYTSNESVKALLQFMREVIAKPTGAFIEFLSHDGTEKGSHSGAKAWAEDPSMVCALSAAKDEDGRQVGVTVEFRKDRAAPGGMGKRTFTYSLADGELKLKAGTEVVGSCAEALLTILWDAHQRGVEALTAKGLRDEAFDRFRRTHKTVENTLARIAGSGKGPNPTPVIRPRRGLYALSPGEIQRRSAEASRAHALRPLSESGGINTKPTAAEGICHPPYETPEGGTGGNGKPPASPQGETKGGTQTPVTAADPLESPPDGWEPHARAREATAADRVPVLLRGEPGWTRSATARRTGGSVMLISSTGRQELAGWDEISDAPNPAEPPQQAEPADDGPDEFDLYGAA